MKLGQLKQAEGSLTKLLEADMPATVAFQLREFTKLVTSKLQILEEVRMSKVKALGTVKEGVISVKPENQEQFQSEMNKVMDEDITLPDVKVSINDLKDAKLSAKDMTALEFLIKE